MVGGIYSDQRCPDCGSRFQDNFKNGLVCPNHPKQQATRFRVYFKGVTRRFSSYQEASRHLTGLRFKTDEGSFDARDYKRDNPLGFGNLAEQWLKIKSKEIKRSSYRHLQSGIVKAITEWKGRNVKEIERIDFELFLNSLEGIATKTKHDHLQALKQFFKWLYENEVIERVPRFPQVTYSLARRKTATKEVQGKILDEVYRIAKDFNVKVWIGIKFLCTYYNCRPGEILNIREGHIDLEQGIILIPDPKERHPKLIYLIEEDIELLSQFPKAINPDLYFFRHRAGLKGVTGGKRFGDHLFYTTWKKACVNLGVEGLDLYGGTRHSTAQALRKEGRTPEEIMLGSGHRTSKAFSRYFTFDADGMREIYSQARGGKKMAKDSKKPFAIN